jgi:hypothetical protein
MTTPYSIYFHDRWSDNAPIKATSHPDSLRENRFTVEIGDINISLSHARLTEMRDAIDRCLADNPEPAADPEIVPIDHTEFPF